MTYFIQFALKKDYKPSCLKMTLNSVLHLQKNKIQSLPSELGCLRLLELLMLSENSLLSLPASLANLQRLKRLDLRHNKIEGSLPCVIYQLHSIVQLFLNYNKINQLQPGIANLRHLSNLDLRFVFILCFSTVNMPIKGLFVFLTKRFLITVI